MTASAHRPKLVMTLLARDEVDIVDANVAYHLNHGVDHVIATDNASRDGTRDILADWARTGRLTLIDEPSDDYRQDIWVTRMALKARDELNADWILPNDADEFWTAPGGDLKAVVSKARADILSCARRNMVTSVEALGTQPWPQNLTARVDPPLPMPTLQDMLNDPLGAPFFYFALPPKVLLRADGLKRIPRGAHNAVYAGEAQRADTDVTVYHFPVRDPDAFEASVRQIGQAIRRDPTASPKTSWKYRRWLAMLERGDGMNAVLQDTLPTHKRLTHDIENGNVVMDQSFNQTLTSSRSRA